MTADKHMHSNNYLSKQAKPKHIYHTTDKVLSGDTSMNDTFKIQVSKPP